MKKLILCVAVSLYFAAFFCVRSFAQTTYDGITIPARAGGTGPTLILNDSATMTRAQAWYAANSWTPPAVLPYGYRYNDLDIPFTHIMGNGSADCHGIATIYDTPRSPPLLHYEFQNIAQNSGNFAKSWGTELAVVFDWCYDVLSPAEKTAYVSIIDAYTNDLIGNSLDMYYGSPNDEAVINFVWSAARSVMLNAIITYNEPGHTATSQAWLDQVTQMPMNGSTHKSPWPVYAALTTNASGIAAMGAFPESAEYSRQQLSYSDIMCRALLLNNGSDFCGTAPWYHDAVFSYIYATTQNPVHYKGNAATYYEFFPFGDDQSFAPFNNEVNYIVSSPTVAYGSYAGDGFTWLVDNFATSNPTVARWARTYQTIQGATGRADRPRTAISNNSAVTPFSNFNALALDLYEPRMGVALGRSDWTGNGTQFYLKELQPNISSGHSHFDGGMYQLTRGSRWLSRESPSYSVIYQNFGGVIPTWTASTTYNPGDRINISGSAALETAASCTSGSTVPTVGAIGTNYSDNTCSWFNLNRNMPLGVEGLTTSTESTVIHNGILFEGLGQADAPIGDATVNNTDSNAGYFHIDSDLTKLYSNNVPHPDRNNPFVNPGGHVEREFLFIRSLETLVVFDRLQALAKGSITAANVGKTFLSECEVNWTIEDGKHARCDNVDQTLRISTLLPASTITQTVVDEKNCTGCYALGGQYRYEATGTDGAISYQLNVLQARAIGGTNHAVSAVTDSNPGSPTSGTFTFTITPSGGSATTVVFQKGVSGAANMGSVNLAGAGAQTFNSTIMAETMSDNGPVWGGGLVTLSSIAVTPTNPSVAKGISQSFAASCTYSDSSVFPCPSPTWVSSNLTVATIDGTGNASTLATGTTNITASIGAVTSNTAVLAVTPATLVSIAVTPNPVTMAATTTQQLTATGTYTDSTTQDLTSTSTWSSTNTGIASVSITGLLTGVSVGSANVTAAFGGVTSPIDPVTVTSGTPSPPTLMRGKAAMQGVAQSH